MNRVFISEDEESDLSTEDSVPESNIGMTQTEEFRALTIRPPLEELKVDGYDTGLSLDPTIKSEDINQSAKSLGSHIAQLYEMYGGSLDLIIPSDIGGLYSMIYYIKALRMNNLSPKDYNLNLVLMNREKLYVEAGEISNPNFVFLDNYARDKSVMRRLRGKMEVYLPAERRAQLMGQVLKTFHYIPIAVSSNAIKSDYAVSIPQSGKISRRDYTTYLYSGIEGSDFKAVSFAGNSLPTTDPHLATLLQASTCVFGIEGQRNVDVEKIAKIREFRNILAANNLFADNKDLFLALFYGNIISDPFDLRKFICERYKTFIENSHSNLAGLFQGIES